MKNKFKTRETIGDLKDGKRIYGCRRMCIDEQFLDVIRGDTHKILSGVYRDLESFRL